MLAVEDITQVPGEQKVIEELDEGLRPLYRDDLPHHNFEHTHDEVLPEVLRLDALQPVRPSRGRLELIAASLGHDAGLYLPADPERLETKEERAVRLIRPTLVECGFSDGYIADVNGMVLATGADSVCKSPGQIKMRRADIANVGGKRLPFLATSVKLFQEAVMLAAEHGHEPPVWRTFVTDQQHILQKLLSQDLSLGDERVLGVMGPFNRAAMRNVGWLSKTTVRDPARFHSRYDRYLLPLVGEEALAAIV